MNVAKSGENILLRLILSSHEAGHARPSEKPLAGCVHHLVRALSYSYISTYLQLEH